LLWVGFYRQTTNLSQGFLAILHIAGLTAFWIFLIPITLVFSQKAANLFLRRIAEIGCDSHPEEKIQGCFPAYLKIDS